MNSFGSKLKIAREQAGLSISDVSRKIKILSCYIKALESEDLEALPTRVYTMGFVCSYADLLGVDKHELCELVKERFGWTDEHKSKLLDNSEAKQDVSQRNDDYVKYAVAVIMCIFVLLFVFIRD